MTDKLAHCSVQLAMMSRASSPNNNNNSAQTSPKTSFSAPSSFDSRQPQSSSSFSMLPQSNTNLLRTPSVRRRSSGSSSGGRMKRNLRAGSFLSPHRFNRIRAQLSAPNGEAADADGVAVTFAAQQTEILSLEPVSADQPSKRDSQLLSPPLSAACLAATVKSATTAQIAKKKDQFKRETRENIKSVLESYSGKSTSPNCGSSNGHKLNQDEEELLYAAEHGFTAQLTSIVEKHSHGIHATLVNCQDFMGRTPIMLAATGEHFDCIDYLVRKSSPQRVLEALLACIEQDLSEVSQYIIKHPVYEVDKIGARIIIGESGDIFYDRSGEDSLQYSSDITPVVLAAQKQQVETLKLLLDRNVRIERPHKITCSCTECRNRAQYDSLKHSRSRLNAYRGLTSPSYIALTASDPITEAFRLSGELRQLSGIEKEFKAQYIELSEQCEKFAVELLDHCRNTQEVRIVLKGAQQQQMDHIQNRTVSAAGQTENAQEAHDQLALLGLAFRYNQKSFVAHPSCQQQVGIFWCNGFSSWRRRTWLYRAAVVVGLMITFPFIELLYLLLGAWPVFQVSRLARMPLVKFVMSVASDFYFVLILVMLGWTSTQADNKLVFCTDLHKILQDFMASRNPLMIARFLICAWILGQLLSVTKRLRHKGFTDFISGWWNFIEFGTCMALLVGHIIMFSDALHTWLLWHVTGSDQSPEIDPSCIGLNQLSFLGHQVYNCLLSLASILTFVRVTMTLFQASESFGPLQISLSRLVPEIAKYIFVFIVLMTSFNIALMMIFREYPAADDTSSQIITHNIVDASGAVVPNTHQVVIGTHPPEWISDEFSTIAGTFRSLFWSLFGMSPREGAELRRRTPDGVVNHSPEPYPHLAEYSGNLLFGSFHVLSIILINILIAALAWGYTEIREDEDTEWKYARTKLRLSYIEQKNFTQPPFNLLPSSVTIADALKNIFFAIPTKFLRKVLQQRNAVNRRFDVESLVSRNDNANDFSFVKNGRDFHTQASLESSFSRQPRRKSISLHNNVRIMPSSLIDGGVGVTATKNAILAAMKMRKQQRGDDRGGVHTDAFGTTSESVGKVLSQYERLMVSLTTRWMHYKFYKHSPPPLQQHAATDAHDIHELKSAQATPRINRQSSHVEIGLREQLEQAIAGIEVLKATVYDVIGKQRSTTKTDERSTFRCDDGTAHKNLPHVEIQQPDTITQSTGSSSEEEATQYVNTAFEGDDDTTSIDTFSTLSDSAALSQGQRLLIEPAGEARAVSLPEFHIEQYEVQSDVSRQQVQTVCKSANCKGSTSLSSVGEQWPLEIVMSGNDSQAETKTSL